MKRCPECRRDYYDETLLYCLDDGNALLEGPASADGPATAILSEPPTSPGASFGSESPIPNSAEAPTRAQINITDQTAILPRETEAGPQGNKVDPSERQMPQRKVGGPQFAVVAIGILILVGGFFGYRYFGSPKGEQISSIAVLPFENRSGNADTDYLSDGLADSLIFRLSQLPNLKVSPTTSVMRYKGKNTDVAQIAKDLNVDAVMSGRLVQLGESLNISVQLIDVRSEKLIWAEQYDRKLSDLLTTQREIAVAISQKLHLKLGGNERGVTKKYTDSNEAYQLYLKGRFHFAKRTKADLFKSIEILEQAVKLDPHFALGYVGIAESWTVIPSFPYASPGESVPKAKAAAAKALELDPDLPEAHTVSAMISATYDWDWAKAEAGFKRALELDPNLAVTHYRYAWTYLSPMGRHDEAVAEMKIAMEKEPLYLIQGANFAGVLMYARRFEEAAEQARKTYDLDPTFVASKSWLCHTYNLAGRYQESLEIAEKSADSDLPFTADLGFAYAKTGQRDKALAVIERAGEAEKKRYVQNYWVAVAYAAMGDKDNAFVELEKAYQHHDWFLQRLKVDPFVDPLRDDPRFAGLLRRLNLPE